MFVIVTKPPQQPTPIYMSLTPNYLKLHKQFKSKLMVFTGITFEPGLCARGLAAQSSSNWRQAPRPDRARPPLPLADHHAAFSARPNTTPTGENTMERAMFRRRKKASVKIQTRCHKESPCWTGWGRSMQ